jgi:hypothetical protein
MIRAENKYVAPVWLDEVVTKFIDEDLIARVHRAPGDNLIAPANPFRENVKIVNERFRRSVNKKLLMLTDETREGEKEEKFLLLDLQDLIILMRHDVDVIAAEHNELADLPQNVRRWCRAGMADDSI